MLDNAIGSVAAARVSESGAALVVVVLLDVRVTSRARTSGANLFLIAAMRSLSCDGARTADTGRTGSIACAALRRANIGEGSLCAAVATLLVVVGAVADVDVSGGTSSRVRLSRGIGMTAMSTGVVAVVVAAVASTDFGARTTLADDVLIARAGGGAASAGSSVRTYVGGASLARDVISATVTATIDLRTPAHQH
jgi:hypothetical protein